VDGGLLIVSFATSGAQEAYATKRTADSVNATEALDDRRVLTEPPRSEQEWGSFADTVCDHLYAEVKRFTDRPT